MLFDSDISYFIDNDEFHFLEGVNSWSSHRPMLLLALHLTQGDVIEFGSGSSSSLYLRAFCKKNNRNFFSYDNNKEWAEKTNAVWIKDWSSANIYNQCGLCFVDEAPGDNRIKTIERMKDKADIIVVHDTEIDSAADYKFEKIWHLFKYRIGYGNSSKTTGTTALSNSIDLGKFEGFVLSGYKFEK